MDMRILLVEADRELTDLIQKGLAEYVAELDIAPDGLSGRKMLFESPYDMVILDAAIPLIDGLELCKEMRWQEESLAILLLLESNDQQEISRGMLSGADDCLAKPFTGPELYERVVALHRRRLGGTWSFADAH